MHKENLVEQIMTSSVLIGPAFFIGPSCTLQVKFAFESFAMLPSVYMYICIYMFRDPFSLPFGLQDLYTESYNYFN